MLRVSPSGRYLIDGTGRPFFYLADTAWALLHTPTFEEVAEYLRVRREQGFTVVMPTIAWRLERGPHRYGLPFEGDPARPNGQFFRHVDRVVELASGLGLVLALMPSWGRFVIPGDDAVLTPENAGAYGRFLGERYRDADVLWVLGGDRNPLPSGAEPAWREVGSAAHRPAGKRSGDQRSVATWRALAEGLDAGDRGSHLMTYHPAAVHSSAEWFHDEPWLDFNMWQTSTWLEIDYCRTLLEDYDRLPVKPFVDGEVRYEHSHRTFSPFERAAVGVRMTAQRVRQAAYYALLCGAMGHTYGCRDVWTFHVPPDVGFDVDVDTHWREALRFPGAETVQHLRSLFAASAWPHLAPDRGELVLSGRGDGNLRVQAARAADGRSALAYLPEPADLLVDVRQLDGAAVDATWFDPTTGRSTPPERLPRREPLVLRCPSDPGDRDRVLVLRAVG